MCAKDREFLYMVRYVCHINYIRCARFSLEADKMGIFVIEILIEALLLKIVWHMVNLLRIFSYTFVTIYYRSLSLIFFFGRVRKIAKSD